MLDAIFEMKREKIQNIISGSKKHALTLIAINYADLLFQVDIPTEIAFFLVKQSGSQSDILTLKAIIHHANSWTIFLSQSLYHILMLKLTVKWKKLNW